MQTTKQAHDSLELLVKIRIPGGKRSAAIVLAQIMTLLKGHTTTVRVIALKLQASQKYVGMQDIREFLQTIPEEEVLDYGASRRIMRAILKMCGVIRVSCGRCGQIVQQCKCRVGKNSYQLTGPGAWNTLQVDVESLLNLTPRDIAAFETHSITAKRLQNFITHLKKTS